MSLPPATDTGGSSGAPSGAGGNPVPPPMGLPSGTDGASPGIAAVLRKIVTDPNFRLQFASDPVLAVTSAAIPVTSEDMQKLESLDAAQLDQLAQGVNALSDAATGASGLVKKMDGTNTLIYAVIVAVLLAVRAR